MKIAFLFQHFAFVGGIERIWQQKISLLAECQNFEVYLITYNQGDHPFAFPLSDKVKHTDLNTRFSARCSYKGLYKYIDRYKSIRKFQKAVKECLLEIRPDVVTTIDSHYNDSKAVRLSGFHGKHVIENHTGSGYFKFHLQEIPWYNTPNAYYNSMQMKKELRHCNAIVSLTEADAKKQKDYTKTEIIPNMLVSYPETTSKSNKEHKRIIAAGRITPQKGFDILADSWELVVKKHPDWKLDVFGNNYEGTRIRQANGMTIHAATDQIYDEYRKSDFFVLPSRYESFGLVLIEAMSCGTPCIAFDCPYGPREIIHDGEDGILAKNGNVEDLAKKIIWMIEHREERQAIGDRARENVKRYLPENIMPKWITFYNSLMKK